MPRSKRPTKQVMAELDSRVSDSEQRRVMAVVRRLGETLAREATAYPAPGKARSTVLRKGDTGIQEAGDRTLEDSPADDGLHNGRLATGAVVIDPEGLLQDDLSDDSGQLAPVREVPTGLTRSPSATELPRERFTGWADRQGRRKMDENIEGNSGKEYGTSDDFPRI